MRNGPCRDRLIVFIPLTVQNREDLWLRGKIIERHFIGTISHVFPFSMEVELIQFVRGELLSLPQKIVTVGGEVPKTPPREVVVERLLQGVVSHEGALAHHS
jgi:hypothetical protein